MAYVEKKTILLGEWRDVTGDRERDGLILGLRAVEAREGERLGWNNKVRVWTLHLADIDSAAVELRPVAVRHWRTGQANPADDLIVRSRQLLPPDRDVPRLAFADAPDGIAAVVFMSEGWIVDLDKLTDDQRRRRAAGQRVAHESEHRVEVRTMSAVDINGYGYTVGRRRGEPLEDTVALHEPHEMWAAAGQGPGNLIRALYCLAYNARIGAWPR